MEELTNENMAIEPQQLSIAWVRFILDVLETILLAAILFLTINALSARVRVEGTSMVPTLQNEEFVLVNRLAYQMGTHQRGDIIVFHHPSGQKEEDLIKRIIGLPGETVAFVNGHVLINGNILDEPYEKSGYNWNSAPVTLGPNQYYVVGDNRSMPAGDHVHGVFERTQIVGKALL